MYSARKCFARVDSASELVGKSVIARRCLDSLLELSHLLDTHFWRSTTLKYKYYTCWTEPKQDNGIGASSNIIGNDCREGRINLSAVQLAWSASQSMSNALRTACTSLISRRHFPRALRFSHSTITSVFLRARNNFFFFFFCGIFFFFTRYIIMMYIILRAQYWSFIKKPARSRARGAEFFLA